MMGKAKSAWHVRQNRSSATVMIVLFDWEGQSVVFSPIDDNWTYCHSDLVKGASCFRFELSEKDCKRMDERLADHHRPTQNVDPIFTDEEIHKLKQMVMEVSPAEGQDSKATTQFRKGLGCPICPRCSACAVHIGGPPSVSGDGGAGKVYRCFACECVWEEEGIDR